MAVLGGVVLLVLALISGALYSKVNNESPIDAVALEFSAPAAKQEGVYAPNSLLQGVVKLGEGKLSKPEDMVAHPSGQFLYVATADGWVKKLYLKDGAVEDWKFVGGRPLGLALNPDGELIVANTHNGLLKVTDAGVEVLTTEVDGSKFLLLDGVVVAKDGRIFFTDASSKFKLDVHMNDILQGRPTGRIAVYNPADKSTKLLVKDLYFPNGIAISKDDEFLIFAETTLCRLSKYYLMGEKKGTVEIINGALPAFPDNVHYNYEKGILYVGIVGERDPVTTLLWKLPFLKKVVAMLPWITAAVDNAPKFARILVIDENGKPLKLYEDLKGKVMGFVTGAIEVDGYLYVGGLRDDFIGRIPV
jgi:sugar lactone lactonase YvrE